MRISCMGNSLVYQKSLRAVTLPECCWFNPHVVIDLVSSGRPGVPSISATHCPNLDSHGQMSVNLGLGVGIETTLGPLAAAYVLFMAILGPILEHFQSRCIVNAT